ncbi:MAG: methyltransferase domain-containing protein [Rubrivivax sp.]
MTRPLTDPGTAADGEADGEPAAELRFSEPQAMHARYARRAALPPGRYSLLEPAALRERQGRQRALVQQLLRHGRTDLSSLTLTELGCGLGGNLLELLQLGFRPHNLHGIELLPDRHAAARQVLPPALSLWLGDGSIAPVSPQSQDLVLVSTVYSSVLDDGFQQRLADATWRWLKPGGAVIVYDFRVDNPRNPDVRGVPAWRLRALYPQGRAETVSLTLAPPLARAVGRLHPVLIGALAGLPPLRTHLLAWIAKPRQS